eukprot:1796892-Rhodomonas_salina.1
MIARTPSSLSRVVVRRPRGRATERRELARTLREKVGERSSEQASARVCAPERCRVEGGRTLPEPPSPAANSYDLLLMAESLGIVVIGQGV